ncbi:MAG: T9SS type A sorting domain-containing protein [Phaeodactylibacter sp.]|nr:T9SS type A sorting domain-containing protein [Phaeodactylibacter sp.]MCB9292546.1 T9SS type A sorting domain-containing protein [Lewinellaceae bacterium]
MKQLLLLLFFLPLSLCSQQLDDVVASVVHEPAQGSGGGQMIWTLGELMVEYYANGPVLDQGYLQLRCLLTSTSEAGYPESPDWDIGLWPNPAGSSLNIRTSAPLRITLFDNLGRRLKELRSPTGTTILGLSAWPAGSYWLHAVDEKGRSRAYQVQKL